MESNSLSASVEKKSQDSTPKSMKGRVAKVIWPKHLKGKKGVILGDCFEVFGEDPLSSSQGFTNPAMCNYVFTRLKYKQETGNMDPFAVMGTAYYVALKGTESKAIFHHSWLKISEENSKDEE